VNVKGAKAGDRLVGNWLLIICVMIFGMVAGGGHARTIGAGFSILVWQPFFGFIPPLTQAAWAHLFGLYRQTSQYNLIHPAMTLAQFQSLFWPMFIDRVWGRVMGLVFVIPLALFWWRERISTRLALWLAGLFAAGAIEATMGWMMVKIAFTPGVTTVPPIWLAPHFILAMLIFSAMLWTALTIKRPVAEPITGAAHLRPWLNASIGLIIVTMGAGALVAATNAITVFNTFPLMDGKFIPHGFYALHPAWLNYIDNKATVQFDHRILATITAITVVITAIMGLRAPLSPKGRDAFLILAGFVSLQYILGMTALVSAMPEIGYVHELNAVLLLASAITARHALRGALPIRAAAVSMKERTS
jgi:cytochrome c oxidase assembly protein subunit 15